MEQFFSTPISKRCDVLSSYLSNTTLKELSSAYPRLIENIFGFGNEIGWGLEKCNSLENCDEFDVIRKFLSSTGPLFKVIHSLSQDPCMSYEFPVLCLPGTTQREIEERSVSYFIGNRLHMLAGGKLSLILNAFEFYMFHFAYCLVNPKFTQSSVNMNWTNIEECLYPKLLEEYMNAFLPCINSPQGVTNSLPARHSPTQIRHSPLRLGASKLLLSGGQSLLKHSVLSANQTAQPSPATFDQNNLQVNQADSVIQAVTEFWMCQLPGSPRDTSASIHSPTFESRLPSVNVILVLRSFVKHLHYFTNSVLSADSPHYLHGQCPVSPLDEFKRTCVAQRIRKKLYRFLRYSFERWPLDSSFRLILETWLSYIQIWRYERWEDRNRNLSPDKNEPEINRKWFPFICDNLLFYTVMFQEFMKRLQHLDLMSPFFSLMVFRCMKVFSQKNLKSLIKEAEDHLRGVANRRNASDIGESFLSPQQSAALSLISRMNELEPPNFVYQFFFSTTSQEMADNILQHLCTARDKVSSHLMSVENSSWLSWLHDTEYGTKFSDSSELQKLSEHLNSSIQNICCLFDLFAQEPQLNSSQITNTSIFDASYDQNCSSPLPDCHEVNGSIQLTDRGRRQVVNGLRRFDTIYDSDPDCGLVQYRENPVLVRFLHYISKLINDVYQEEISAICLRNDFLGRMARVMFKSVIPRNYSMAPMSHDQRLKLSRHRLCLRPFARYSNIAALTIFYFFTRLFFGFGIFEFLVLGCFLFSIFLVIKAAICKSA